jgi:hypothetical protein
MPTLYFSITGPIIHTQFLLKVDLVLKKQAGRHVLVVILLAVGLGCVLLIATSQHAAVSDDGVCCRLLSSSSRVFVRN